MACYRPLKALITRERHDTGGRVISFGKHGKFFDLDKAIDLPCGRCIGCRLERSRQWAVRLMHERKSHEAASFVTLTYRDEDLPPGGTLVLEHTQNFMKRLREYMERERGERIRFFLAGEYGEEKGRPHYHAILFGVDFAFDREPEGTNHEGSILYKSDVLNDLWKMGHCIIGDVSFESCAYVARYCVKKITGDDAAEYYKGRKPEFATMSRRPGIGMSWFEKFHKDVFPSDEVIVDRRGGRKIPSRPPRAYDEALRRFSEEEYLRMKAERVRGFDPLEDKVWHENSPARLTVKETVKQAQLNQLKRK